MEYKYRGVIEFVDDKGDTYRYTSEEVPTSDRLVDWGRVWVQAEEVESSPRVFSLFYIERVPDMQWERIAEFGLDDLKKTPNSQWFLPTHEA